MEFKRLVTAYLRNTESLIFVTGHSCSKVRWCCPVDICHYHFDKYYQNPLDYPLDSPIHPLINWGQKKGYWGVKKLT